MYKKTLKYTWHKFVLDCLSFSSFPYSTLCYGVDAVLAITNGGFFLGAFVAAKYDLPFFTIRASSYKNKKRGRISIGEVPVLLRNKRILIVDDIIDSGKTMEAVEDALVVHNVYARNRLVVFQREGNDCDCVCFRRAKKGIWVEFPWEELL